MCVGGLPNKNDSSNAVARERSVNANLGIMAGTAVNSRESKIIAVGGGVVC